MNDVEIKFNSNFESHIFKRKSLAGETIFLYKIKYDLKFGLKFIPLKFHSSSSLFVKKPINLSLKLLLLDNEGIDTGVRLSCFYN